MTARLSLWTRWRPCGSARATPGLLQDDAWRIEMTAAIAAARACGVSSDTLADFEALLRG